MRVSLGGLDCCAIREIRQLSTGETPRQVLWKLCKDNWNPYAKKLNKFKPFILFSGVVKIEGSETMDPKALKSELGYASFAVDRNLTYAPKFEKFLRANQLGRVDLVGEAYNDPGHPLHLVRLYCWFPDSAALSRWFDGEIKSYTMDGIKTALNLEDNDDDD